MIKSLGVLSVLLDGICVLSKQQVNFRASAILTYHFSDEWRLNVIYKDGKELVSHPWPEESLRANRISPSV